LSRDTPDDFRTGVNIDTFPASLQAQTRVAGRYRHLGQPSKARLFSVSSHRLNSLVSIAARQASMFRPMAAAASARPSSEKTKDEGKYSFRAWQTEITLRSPGKYGLTLRCTNSSGKSAGFMRNVVEAIDVAAI
jgi:hypothetical protein